MDAEDFIVNNGSKGKVIENVCAVSPNIHASVLPQALVIKPINLRYLPTFVVSSYQGDSFRVSHFKC